MVGAATELKSLNPNYKRIKESIQSAVISARDNLGVTKSRFVVDLGAKALTPKLRQRLSNYNQVQDGHIDQLFVLWGDGQHLEEIPLKRP